MPKRKPARHKNRLQKSSADDIALSMAVQSRFVELCGAYRRIRGVDLVPPSDLDSDLFHWRTMAVRHRQGDFRNSEEELKSLRTIAQWTVDVNRELRNQPPQKIDWGEG